MKKLFLVFGILVSGNSFAAAKCEGLDPARWEICEGIEAAIEGKECVKRDGHGESVCRILSNLLQGKKCDSLPKPLDVACQDTLDGLNEVEAAKREGRKASPGQDQFWRSMGTYFGLNRPFLVRKISEGLIHFKIEEEARRLRTAPDAFFNMLSSLEQEKVIRWVKATFPTVSQHSKSVQIQSWFSKMIALHFVLDTEKKDLPTHTVIEMASPKLKYHLGLDKQAIVHFETGFNLDPVGMGNRKQVSLAFDTAAEKLKVIIKPILADETPKVIPEFRAQSLLKGAHSVAQLEDWFEAEGTVFGVMDYYPWDLDTLHNEMKLYDSWEDQSQEAVAVSMGLQLAEGLEQIHQKNIHHRDIKPKNILTDGSKALISDFSLIFDLENPPRPELDFPGRNQRKLTGTCLYMSPQYVRTGNHRLVSNDVWGLGLVLWNFSTKETSYCSVEKAKEFLDILSKVKIFEDLDNIFSFGTLSYSGLSETPFREVIKKMLQPEPSLNEVRVELQKLKEKYDRKQKFKFQIHPNS